MKNEVLVFDTNVLLRYFLKDIESRYLKVAKIIKGIENKKTLGKLSALVVAETIWVFESVYKLDREVVIRELLKVIALKNIEIIEINKATLIEILGVMIYKRFDFVDVYLSKIASKNEIFSFDKDFQKLYK